MGKISLSYLNISPRFLRGVSPFRILFFSEIILSSALCFFGLVMIVSEMVMK